MSGLKLAGGLCIIAGVNSAGMAFGVWEDGPTMFALALGGAIVGLHRGPPTARPGPEVVRWSNVAGLVWSTRSVR